MAGHTDFIRPSLPNGHRLSPASRLAIRKPDFKLTHYPQTLVLDSYSPFRSDRPFPTSRTMGQQLNKIIKRKRRAAYLKRKKLAAAAAKKK